MNILECLHTESKCYRAAQKAEPVGIVVHSTGVNQKRLSRYVQPSSSDPNREALLAKIGGNRYGNSWNRDVDKSTHYMIGELADGSVGVVKLLPENLCAWGVGSGKKGSYNYNPTAHIQFEVCEDGLTDPVYFRECYEAAVALCADICKRYGWGAEVIVSHREAHAAGYASNHADIDHWLKKFGTDMKGFRNDVAELLSPPVLPKVGDLVSFTGKVHYTNAGQLIGKACRPGKAEVLRIYRLTATATTKPSRHPYLLRAVAGGGSDVYGWVDADTIGEILTPAEEREAAGKESSGTESPETESSEKKEAPGEPEEDDENDGNGGETEAGEGGAEEKTPEEPLAVGDTVSYAGGLQYRNANAKKGTEGSPGKAELLRIYRLGKSRHPYLVKALPGETEGKFPVYGWVDEEAVR